MIKATTLIGSTYIRMEMLVSDIGRTSLHQLMWARIDQEDLIKTLVFFVVFFILYNTRVGIKLLHGRGWKKVST